MPHMLLNQSFFLVASIVIIIIFFLIYSRDNQGLRFVQFLDRSDIIIMVIVTIIYAVISFSNLGSTYRYKNPWHGNNYNDKIILKLATPTVIAKINYFIGYKKGSYSVNGIDKNNQSTVIFSAKRSFFYDKNNQYKGACFGCFAWQNLILSANNLQRPFSSIVFNIESAPVDFYKIQLLDRNNKIINYKAINQNHINIFNDLRYDKQSLDFEHSAHDVLIYDEMYYVTSAYQYLHGMVPEIFQQPQLGILVIALGVMLFGISSFSFRIFMACGGILMLPLIYIFARRIFRNREIAILAIFLLFIDPMHYAINQIALLDPLMTLFLFVAYYFLWLYFEARIKGVSFRLSLRYMLFVGMFFGLGVSTKWGVLFSLPVILAILIYTEIFDPNRFKNFISKILSLFVLLIILPVIIYIVFYIPIANVLGVSHLFKFVWQQQLSNLAYMMSIYSNNWYSSRAWQWLFNQGTFPLVIVPGVDAINNKNFDLLMHGNCGEIWLFYLNPGLIGIFFPVMLVLLYKLKNKSAFFIFLSIISQYMPYFFLKRTLYIYYFYAIEPLLILGVCFMFNELKVSFKNNYKKLLSIYVLINLSAFIWFLPLMYGFNSKLWYVLTVYRSLIWLSFIVQAFILIVFYRFYCYNLGRRNCVDKIEP